MLEVKCSPQEFIFLLTIYLFGAVSGILVIILWYIFNTFKTI